jgi:hypothetical protein
MLKRHYGASLRDWLGAAEYLMVEGNQKIILCERGVSVPHTHRATSRYLMDLQVVPAAQEMTHLPIVIDPSHATFWRPWVAPMALAGVAAGADGVLDAARLGGQQRHDHLHGLNLDIRLPLGDVAARGHQVAQQLAGAGRCLARGVLVLVVEAGPYSTDESGAAAAQSRGGPLLLRAAALL